MLSHMHPDRGYNPQPFGLWDKTLPNGATPARAKVTSFKNKFPLLESAKIYWSKSLIPPKGSS